MKKIALLTILTSILLCPFCLTSCSDDAEDNDDVIWDFAPIGLYIHVHDADGNDLLDSLTVGNILDQGITATFGEEECKLKLNPYASTRAYLPHFMGLVLLSSEEAGWYMYFGELDGAKNFDNMDITLNWGDGTHDVFTIYSRVTWKGDEPQVDRRFYLNGQEQESAVFNLIKQ